MARYADIDDLIINKSHCDRDGSRFVYCDDIEPTADVVPVVRCKDCKYFDQAEKYCCDFLTAEEDGFCKWGERRDDG